MPSKLVLVCVQQLVSLTSGMLHAAMYEDIKEYLNWYDTRKDMVFAKDAPIIGLVLQRSHLVTGDEGHYSGVVSEMEARGAKVGQRKHIERPVQDAGHTRCFLLFKLGLT